MAFSTHVSPSHFLKTSCFLSFLTKTPPLLFKHPKNRNFLHHPHSHSPKPITRTTNLNFPIDQKHHLCTSTARPSRNCSTPRTLSRTERKAYQKSEEGLLRRKLDMCSKKGELIEALRLYDEATSNKLSISIHHYNCLLYICSSVDVLVDGQNLGLTRGFQIFKQMGIHGIPPNEATFTSAARLAAKAEDPDMAFELVKKMMRSNILPKLRSYDPALFGFCKKREADKAYEIDSLMLASGIIPEEPQLAALLQVSVDVERAEKVYELLHRLRISVRQVSEDTAEIVERWFKSRAGMEAGKDSWDVEKVKEGAVKGGGGWHGQGWLGKGEWKVGKTEMDENGVCSCCGERLVCIDIDPLETENFANVLSNLACQKEVRADFNNFQDWLRCNGPFDAVIDGANVSLNNSHSFSFFQLNAGVERARKLSSTKKMPLIILHSSRVNNGPAVSPNNKKLIEKWQRSGALYTTPKGSNDDWYWLYAAVSSKCLLVTNDEMRDHLFQLLGTGFFPRWKEKHQYLPTFSKFLHKMELPCYDQSAKKPRSYNVLTWLICWDRYPLGSCNSEGTFSIMSCRMLNNFWILSQAQLGWTVRTFNAGDQMCRLLSQVYHGLPTNLERGNC